MVDEVERLNRDKYFGALYDMEEENTRWKNTYREIGYDEGIEQGIEQGKVEGLKEGIKKASHDIALKLKRKGISLDLIKDITGIDLNHKED